MTFVPFRVTTRPRKCFENCGWIVADNGCHIWQAAKDAYGYGVVSYDGKQDCVHRIRYRREVGPVPPGMVLDHYVCDGGPNACCNPAHVRPVSRRENNLRGGGIASRLAARTHCANGHLLGGDNTIPSRMRTENNRMCKTCYNEKRKAWRRARLARGCLR